MATSRPAASTVLAPLGLLGLVGAWLASDYFRFDGAGSSANLRGALIAAATTSAIGLGLVSMRSKGLVGTLTLATVGTLALGALFGASSVWLGPHTYMVGNAVARSALDGVGASLAFLPAIEAILFAGRTAARSRPGSLVGGADRRAPYAIAALATVVAVPLALRGVSCASRFAIPLDVSMAFGALAWLGTLAVFVADAAAWARARAWLETFGSLEPRDPNDLREVPTCDLGLGDAEQVLVERGLAYRSESRVRAGLRGDLLGALAALKAHMWRSAIAFVAATAAIAVSLATLDLGAKSRMDDLRQSAELEADRARDQLVPQAKAGRLPTSCEAYFLMAGGCVSRIAEPDRDRIAKNLDALRSDWVTGGDREVLDGACTSGLYEVLARPECTKGGRGPRGGAKVVVGARDF